MTRGSAQRPAGFQIEDFRLQIAIVAVPAKRVILRKEAVILRLDGATSDLFHVTAVANPFCPQCRQAFGYINLLIGVAPWTARVVNADRLIHLDLAAHRFCRGE